MAPDVYQDTLDFTSKLGGALATYGAPAHRIEDVLRLLTQDLGVDGTFSATPSILLMEFQGPTGRDLRIERVYTNHIDLTRLRRLDRLFNQVADKRLSPREGSQQLEAIVQAPRGLALDWTLSPTLSPPQPPPRCSEAASSMPPSG